MSLGQSMNAVYNNPQCNWECCLSVILSAQDTSPNLQDGAGDGDNSVKDSSITIRRANWTMKLARLLQEFVFVVNS